MSNLAVRRLLAPGAAGRQDAPTDVLRMIARLRGTGQGLPTEQRASLEAYYGYDLAPVRVHQDLRSDALARSLVATAFTSGRDIFLSASAPPLRSADGRRLLAHEVSHVVDDATGADATPAGRVSGVADRTERRADRNARHFGTDRRGEAGIVGLPHGSRGGIGRQTGASQPSSAAPDVAAAAVGELSPPRYRVHIVGHASPRWRRPGADTAAQRNLELSEQRAAAVEDALRSAFRSRPMPVEFELVSRVEDDADSLVTDWRGSTETIVEAHGDADANAQVLRRVDVSVEVLETAHLTTGMSVARELPAATTDWSVYIDTVLSAAMGGGVSWGQGRLKNRRTGQVVRGSWIGGGGGGGLDLPIPAASIDSGWKDFSTARDQVFSSFDGTPVRYTEVAVGVGLGYGVAYFSFSWFMEPVYVGGVAFNQWGAGGSVTAGPWSFSEPIPAPPVVADEVIIPYTAEVGTSYARTLTFPTGSAAIDGAQLDDLADLVTALP